MQWGCDRRTLYYVRSAVDVRGLHMTPQPTIQKRTRASTACDSCRRRKVRCDGGYPACANCIEKDQECVYTALPRKSIPDAELSVLNNRIDILQRDVKRLAKVQYILSRDRNHELSSFNDRMAALKTFTSTNQESSTPLISGIFLSIVSPKEISQLSQKLEYPLLWQYLEQISHDLWSETHKQLVQYDEATFFCPDAKYLDKCRDLYSRAESPYICGLLSRQELDSLDWTCLSGSYQRAVLSAIMIVGSVVLSAKSESEGISKSSVKAHKGSALFQAIRSLNSFRFSGTDLFGIRLSVLLLWLLFSFSSFPSTMRYLSHISSRARSMGLDRDEVNKKYTEREAAMRTNTWFLLCNLHDTLVIPGSLKPTHELYVTFQRNHSTSFDEEVTKQAAIVSDIYVKVRKSFFSAESSEDTLNAIYRLDAELMVWEQSLPSFFFQVGSSKDPCLLRSFAHFSFTDMKRKFYHMVILIHSTCAFRLRDFQENSLGSLKKLTEAARALLELEFSTLSLSGECSILQNYGITAAIFCLFCKNICYPHEITNYEDLRLLQRYLHIIESDLGEREGICKTSFMVWSSIVNVMGWHHRKMQPTGPSESMRDDNLVLASGSYAGDYCSTM